MNGGSRIQFAQLAAIMLTEVCQQLQIPIAVIGHSAVHNQERVVHNHYIDFDSRDTMQQENLAHIKAYHNTREGVSVQYAGQYLLTRPEADKILITISDGMPFHPTPYGLYAEELAQKDTARVVQQLERDGVKVFGVAIGDGKNEIKKIYTKDYIDIPNLKALPQKLVNLIQQNLLK